MKGGAIVGTEQQVEMHSTTYSVARGWMLQVERKGIADGGGSNFFVNGKM